jgi:D-alanyl-lipoteichoic acid acyltransferase DltB (MBOAT superfamily)
MPFNSIEFLFVFLPLTIVCLYVAAARAPNYVITILIVGSFIFYGSSSVLYLGLFVALMIFNYGLAASIISTKRQSTKHALVTTGCVANLCVLAYFKYRVFAADIANDAFGLNIAVASLALPLGISFFIFQKIAFLVDAYQGRIQRLDFRDYLLFVAFFPQLIAGPIVHYGDMQPQFDRAPWKNITAANFAYAICFIAVGLFKKLALADNVSPYANALFNATATGTVPTLSAAWIGCLAFGLQIYFDFSGYSDIAVGLAALFGVQLPFNFASPYQATGIIEFWRRWNITLSRFLRDYVYIPLGGNRNGRRYINLFVTMALGGLWHGAAWTFVAWGVVHGALLSINHLWRGFCARFDKLNRLDHWRGITFVYWVLTFVSVTLAWCFFRAPTFAAAITVGGAMLGVGAGDSSLFGIYEQLLVAAAVAWVALLPNSQEIVKRIMSLPNVPFVAAGAAQAIVFTIAMYFLMAHQYEKFIYFMF